MSTSPDQRPALLGGRPIRLQGPPAWPAADSEIQLALLRAYEDGSWGKYHGGHVERLEERLALYHELPHVVTCSSGTFAVELALRGLKIGPGDGVLLAAYDYAGNFLSIHAVGATPVLVDVAPGNWNLDLEQLPAAVDAGVRAVIVSHLHGGMVAMRELMSLAEARGLRVIEDAAQAPGALVQGRKAGAWGDAGILSFGGSKLLTAGRGGALLTRHADVYQRARVHLQRGNNLCPLSELQAAVLLPQLARLDARNQARAQSVAFLRERLAAVPGLRLFVNPCPDVAPAYYKLGLQYDAAAFGLSRDRLVAALRAEGIAFDEGFRGLHIGRSPSRFRSSGRLPNATQAHAGTVVLHHPILLGSTADVEDVARAVHKTFAQRHALGQLDSAPADD